MTTASEHHVELLARFQAGDERCLAELLQDFEPEIRRVARLRLGPLLRPHLDSLDMVQSVCVTLIEGFRRDQFTVTQPEQLVALAAGIIRRKIARTWRRLRTQIAAQARLSDQGESRSHAAGATVDAHDPAVEIQRQHDLEKLLSHVDPEDRHLLELRLEGFSTAEAARQMGANADVLRVRLSRLRKRLEASGITPQTL
jgi:RNA polymerase sigma factor (sigma-70 family)